MDLDPNYNNINQHYKHETSRSGKRLLPAAMKVDNQPSVALPSSKFNSLANTRQMFIGANIAWRVILVIISTGCPSWRQSNADWGIIRWNLETSSLFVSSVCLEILEWFVSAKYIARGTYKLQRTWNEQVNRWRCIVMTKHAYILFQLWNFSTFIAEYQLWFDIWKNEMREDKLRALTNWHTSLSLFNVIAFNFKVWE